MCSSFWQRPKVCVADDADTPWYCNVPLGKNTLYAKMKKISESAGCSRVHTNHCLRATSVQALDDSGFASRDIMSVSGHHSESSIKNYSRTSEAKKMEISDALSTVMAPETSSSTAVLPVEFTDVPVNIIGLVVGPADQDSQLELIDNVLCEISNSPNAIKPLNINAKQPKAITVPFP